MNSSPSPESDPLAAAEERRLQQLFRDGATDYIDDAGFTARVLGRLPVARQRREWRRRLLVGAAALAGAAGAAVFGSRDLAVTLSDGWALLAEWSSRPVPGLETLGTTGSLIVLVGALGFAWWTRREA